MLQNFSSIPAKLCITLLLWAHTLGMAMAKKIIVDDTETDKIVYSKGWTENHGCPGCPEHLRQSPVYNSTWHSGERTLDPNGNMHFNFTFTGTSVEVRYIAICSGSDLVQVSYSIDGGTEKYAHNCLGSGFLYNRALLFVPGLSNEEHTLRVEVVTMLWLDYLAYEEENPNGAVNSIKATAGGTPTSLSTPPSPTSLSTEVAQKSSASGLSNTDMALIIVSGIMVFALAIVGILWHRSKKRSKKCERRWPPPPLLEDLPPPPTPPIPQTTSVTTYDPPGYTEKNAYFGIQSLWRSSMASEPKLSDPPEHSPLPHLPPSRRVM